MRAEAQRERLPKERRSITHKFRVGSYEGYITAGMYEDGTLGEIFLTDVGKEGSMFQGVMGAFATDFSVALQYGAPVDVLCDKLLDVRFEPGPTASEEIPHAASIIDYIGRWLALRFGSDELRAQVIARIQAEHPGTKLFDRNGKPLHNERSGMEHEERTEAEEQGQAAGDHEHNRAAEGSTGGEQVENRPGGDRGPDTQRDRGEAPAEGEK